MGLEEELINDIEEALRDRYKENDISFEVISKYKKTLLISVDGYAHEIYVARIPSDDKPQNTDDSEREDMR